MKVWEEVDCRDDATSKATFKDYCSYVPMSISIICNSATQYALYATQKLGAFVYPIM